MTDQILFYESYKMYGKVPKLLHRPTQQIKQLTFVGLCRRGKTQKFNPHSPRIPQTPLWIYSCQPNPSETYTL